jgi:hypothetical protein
LWYGIFPIECAIVVVVLQQCIGIIIGCTAA